MGIGGVKQAVWPDVFRVISTGDAGKPPPQSQILGMARILTASVSLKRVLPRSLFFQRLIGSRSERDGGITVGGGMRMVGRVAQKR